MADDKLGRALNAGDPNLKAFQSRGGKLILYHGWADAAIPPVNTVNYYESITKKMGKKTSDEFVRLYMVPGMEHCRGERDRTNSARRRVCRATRATTFRWRWRTGWKKGRRPRRLSPANRKAEPRCGRGRCVRIRWWRSIAEAEARTRRGVLAARGSEVRLSGNCQGDTAAIGVKRTSSDSSPQCPRPRREHLV